MPELLLAIDGGTESLRAAIFDASGKMLGSAASAYPTEFAHPNWAEQQPEDWWASAATACAGALADAGADGEDIAAICADTTCCSVVAAKTDGSPLRPCLLWMDVRASEQADAVAQSGDPALAVNGAGSGPVSAEWMIPKALWLKQNEPELFAAADVVCEYQDWLNWRLTGNVCASLNTITARWHYSRPLGGWPTRMLESLDIAELEGKWPSRIIAPGEVIDGLCAQAAAHLGLPQGIPVVQGGADAIIGMVGLGVVQPGDAALITGSSHLLFLICENEYHAPGVWGTYADSVYQGRQYLEGGQTSTGSIVNWFQRELGSDTSLDALDAEAAKIAPGCDGLLALDHFQGNRTPHTDPLSIGALVGLSLSHSRAHVHRAILEGICFGTRLLMDEFRKAGEVSRVVIAGGATRSDLWLQIHADTLGLPIERTAVADASLLGCAILGATGAGIYDSIEAGCAAMVHPSEKGTVEPDADKAKSYEQIYSRYLQLYPALRPLSAKS